MHENENQASVPYFIHEGQMARMERIYRITVRALIIALAISVISFVINDSLWRQYCNSIESRYHSEESDAGIYEQPDTGDHS